MPAITKPRKRRADCFFGLHFDLHPGDKDTVLGRHVTPAMVRKIIRACRLDFIQYDCKGHVGYMGYPQSRVSASAGGAEGKGIVKDSLAIYRRATEQAGVALCVHFSGVWDSLALKDHPEWAAVNADGVRSANATSTFGPYVRERMIPQMKEVADRYRVDGFWVDGDCWAAEIDYCPAAREKFRLITGKTDPPTKPEEPYWYEWMTIQRDQFFAYAREYMDAIHAHAPGVEVASNWLYSHFAPEPVRLPVDFISGDMSHSDSVTSARFNARYMANVGLTWDLASWGFAIGEGGVHAQKPVEQLMQEAAAVLPLGGAYQIYYSPDRHGGFPDWQIDAMRRVADFCHARKAVCFKTQPVPQVALLLDTTTFLKTNTSLYTPYGGVYIGLAGMLHAMLDAGHSVDVLADHQLPWQQDHWPLIVVPEWRMLPVGVVDELVQYARRGGSLLIAGAHACGLFREHLGVEFVGEPAERCVQLQWPRPPRGRPRWATPVRGWWQEVAPPTSSRQRTIKVIAQHTADRAATAAPQPAATLAPLGRGRIAAFYGPLGTSHLEQHAPAVRDLVGHILNLLYRPRVAIDARRVDLAVREKEGRLIAHLSNIAGMTITSNPYPTTDYVPPTGPVTVRIRVPARPRRVTLEPGGERLAIRWARGVLTVTVPSIHIHAAVVVE